MTLFGKFVFAIVAVGVSFGVFYGVVSVVKKDQMIEVRQPVKENESVVGNGATSVTTASSTDTKTPFYVLLGQSGSRKCTVNQSMGTISSKGVVYMYNGTVRADFSMSIMNTTINSSMVARDGYMYAWTDKDATKGTKIKMPTAASIETTGPLASSSGAVKTWDGRQVTDYSCEDWKVDQKVFDLPTSISFTEQ